MKSWLNKETEILDSILVYLPSFEVSTIAIFTSNISTNSAWEHRTAEKHAVSPLGSSGLGDLNGMTMLANGYGMPTYAGLNADIKTYEIYLSQNVLEPLWRTVLVIPTIFGGVHPGTKKVKPRTLQHGTPCKMVKTWHSNPIPSMYGIFAYIYHKNWPNVCKLYIYHWTIRGWFGNQIKQGHAEHRGRQVAVTIEVPTFFPSQVMRFCIIKQHRRLLLQDDERRNKHST